MDDTVLPVIRLQPGRVLLPGGIALMRVGNHEDHAVVGQNGKDNNVVNDDTTLSPLVALLESRLLGEARSEWVGLLPADVTDVTDVADAHASAATMSKSVPLEDAPGTLPSMPGSSIIGCACRVLRVDKTVIGSGSGAAYVLTVEGAQRFRVDAWLQRRPFLEARVTMVPSAAVALDATVEVVGDSEDAASRARSSCALADLRKRIRELLRVLEALGVQRRVITRLGQSFERMNGAMLTDALGNALDLSVERKLALLRAVDVDERVHLLLEYTQHGTGTADERALVSTLARSAPVQRIAASSSTLSKGDDDADEMQELENRIAAAGLPAEAQKVAERELKRLKRINPMQAEHTVIRSYLECMADLPWQVCTEEHVDISRARHQLDEDHYGLDKVKERILQYLAVRKLSKDSRGPIICLVGPPGVGKTSLGKSIAASLGRKFHRIALGGVHDVAEIKGHRRTYIGSMPGLILQGLKNVGTSNPVFLLDEVDKLGRDPIRGDPTSALLEVLDPEQNSTFRDHYLNVPFDLSRVLFVATANSLDSIPPPLLDRMEVIPMAGYTLEEKLHIARRYLLPKQRRLAGLAESDFLLDDAALRFVVESYTREPGVRNLERQLAAICRSVAFQIASSQEDPQSRSDQRRGLDMEELDRILGPPRFEDDIAECTSIPGVALGLAWTGTGSGGTLFIECSSYAGTGKLVLTGKLGDIIRESAQTALSWVRSHLSELYFSADTRSPQKIDFSAIDVHIHMPAGATPKDGPSAGVALAMALVSLFTDRIVRSDTAMTGELTLRGLVLPVGGIKEKILAAHRYGLRRVVLPARNRKDVEADVPTTIRESMEFIYVRNVEHAIRATIGEFEQLRSRGAEGVANESRL